MSSLRMCRTSHKRKSKSKNNLRLDTSLRTNIIICIWTNMVILMYVLSRRFYMSDFTLILGEYGESHVKTKSVLEKNLFDRIFWTCVFSVIWIIFYVMSPVVMSAKRISFRAIGSKIILFVFTRESFEPILSGNVSNFEWLFDKTSQRLKSEGFDLWGPSESRTWL